MKKRDAKELAKQIVQAALENVCDWGESFEAGNLDPEEVDQVTEALDELVSKIGKLMAEKKGGAK